MRVMVALEDRFFRTQNGNIYSNTVYDYVFWSKYLQVFDEVEREVSRPGLSKHFAMVQELEDIRQFYAAVDVFILPSRYEGMPVSIIEAQAAGKPVVASRLDGIRIATANEMKKNLFAVDDVDAFSKCLINLLKDKEKRITLGKIGQSYVQKNLDIKIAVRKYEKLYLPKELR